MKRHKPWIALWIGLFGLLSLADLPAASAASSLSCEGGTATSFRLRGKVERPGKYTVTKLQKLASTTREVSYFAGNQGLVTKTYKGVALWDLIDAAGLITDPARKNDSLRKYVVITGTDCYQAIVAVGDLLSDFGDQQVLVAYADRDGQPLGEDGSFRLVVPHDKKGGRYVSNIVQIDVRSAPAP